MQAELVDARFEFGMRYSPAISPCHHEPQSVNPRKSGSNDSRRAVPGLSPWNQA